MAGPRGQSSPCAPWPGFPRGGGFSLCFCPHPTSVLLPVTHRAPGALAPSPQLHLGRQRGGSLRVCKTRALFHTPLTSLSKGGSGAGGRARRLSRLLAEHPTTRRARGGMRDVSMAARVSSRRRSPRQGKRGPAQAGSPRYSAAKESEQVTSLPSPLRPTSLAHWFFTAKTAPPAQSWPEGMPSCLASLCCINI